MDMREFNSIAMVYADCRDYKIHVWDPENLCRAELVFCGSSNPDKQVNFILSHEGCEYKNPVKAFQDVLDQIIESRFDMSVDWSEKFLEAYLKQGEVVDEGVGRIYYVEKDDKILSEFKSAEEAYEEAEKVGGRVVEHIGDKKDAE